MTDKVIVYTTCGSSADAELIAEHLIDLHLAACVNVMPEVASYYRWKGKVEKDTEFLLMIKTARPLVDRIRQEIEKVHKYELPELIVVPIVDGAPNYLNWVDAELAEA